MWNPPKNEFIFTEKPVHPHTRGEPQSCCSRPVSQYGSSPHAWGTLHGIHRAARRNRFIPTRVGNPSPQAARTTPWPVHPHTRGEPAAGEGPHGLGSGSSPHAWGTRISGGQVELVGRFIPTRVGNPCARTRTRPTAAVHPHTRGEPNQPTPAAPEPRGSSPHAWGTLPISVKKTGCRRFIPTRVGNPPGDGTGRRVTTVHPHTRGEPRIQEQTQGGDNGSSPHAWGTHGNSTKGGVSGRFIPTRVGNPCARTRTRPTAAVHPHTRGEP